ncbi:asparaginase [bacterium]|nr:asparaginase [bacterium]
MNESKIKVFVTGGTFDKEYNELNGTLYFKHTHIHEMLELGRCRLNLEIETLMMVDSLSMGNHEREYIIKKCKMTPHEQIVITHGTDTMVKTAKCIANEKLDKTIVMTGAMIPYKFGSSDGLFNLGSALSFAQTLPSGVYIAMNGFYFLWNNVQKNKKIGRFETIN